MIRVLSDGENRHRLENEQGAQIGWIRGRVIGFRGPRSEDESLAAVVAASGPLQSSLAQHYPGWPQREVVPSRLSLVRDGAYEWIADGKQPLARLHRPESDGDVFGLEFVLPSYASEGVAMSVAQVLANALRPHLQAEVASASA